MLPVYVILVVLIVVAVTALLARMIDNSAARHDDAGN